MEVSQKPMNIRTTAIATTIVLVLIFGISIAFFFITDGMDEFALDDYISVHLTVENTDFRLDVDRDIQVVNINYFDAGGMRILSGFNYTEMRLDIAMLNLISMAIDGGLLAVNADYITTIIHQPRNVDSTWLALIEYDLHNVHNMFILVP